MTKVKICGITNKEDAFWASSLGADYIGLNFYKNSIRKVSIKNAKDIVSSLPKFTVPVGVFVNESEENVINTISKIGISHLQFHGDESVEMCKSIKNSFPGIKIIKVIKIRPGVIEEENEKQMYIKNLFSTIEMYLPYIDFLLFDTFIEGQIGGTGQRFNYEILQEIKKLMIENNVNMNFFVSGGLTPENVKEVIDLFTPYGVDVSSGVERLPRRKDFDKMKNFIRAVKK